MPNPLADATKVVEVKIKRVLPLLILWLGLSVGSGVAAAQFINDDVTVHYIGFGAAALLLFWWFLVRWLTGSQWALDLQAHGGVPPP